MISASHNSYLDNGIKFFGPDGFKLSDKVELKIEKLLDNDIEYADPQNIGMAKRIDDALVDIWNLQNQLFHAKNY